MTAIEAQFDGKVFVPEQPADLPLNPLFRLLLVPPASPPAPVGPDEAAWLRSAATSPALDRLKGATEDIHLPTDGKPFTDAR